MFRRICDPNDPVLSHVKTLYENAFPIGERRTWEALLLLLSETKMHFNVIMHYEQFVGFFIYWNLENWLYLEHLAVKSELRGKQHGRKVIEYLKETSCGKLILETELPETAEAKRRFEFYEKLGLQVISYPYKQPPYRKQEMGFPMMLMSALAISYDDCKQLAQCIRHNVYEKFY